MPATLLAARWQHAMWRYTVMDTDLCLYPSLNVALGQDAWRVPGKGQMFCIAVNNQVLSEL